MAAVEPIPDRPAAVAEADGERALVIADYHAGIEAWLRYEEGAHVDSAAEMRRERTLDLVATTGVDRVVFLGDLAHFFGGPHGAERGEIEVLFEELPVPVTVVKGNHDGGIESVAGPDVTVTPTDGVRMGDLGLVHGHTWPSPEVLSAEVVCVGHEHPCVRLEDRVGGRQIEPAWLRGSLARAPFDGRYDDLDWRDPELVVFPAINDLVGCTWVNVDEQEFLAPFLPEGMPDADAYLLDGTRLGDYGRV
ncbi:phosphoesterase [Halobacteriales archaeon QS_1_68_20]|nr:MAG: phosphoesterase [Halobacteriales archaeon QS_1_68_20]